MHVCTVLILANPNISLSTATMHHSALPKMPHETLLRPLWRHYSCNLERHIIYQTQILEKSLTQIAIDFDINLRVIQRVKQTRDGIGGTCGDRRCKGWSLVMVLNKKLMYCMCWCLLAHAYYTKPSGWLKAHACPTWAHAWLLPRWNSRVIGSAAWSGDLSRNHFLYLKEAWIGLEEEPICDHSTFWKGLWSKFHARQMSYKQDLVQCWMKWSATINVSTSKHTVFTRSWIASVADFLCDSDEPIFMGFGRDLSEIQAIYWNTAKKKKIDVAPYVPHIAVKRRVTKLTVM